MKVAATPSVRSNGAVGLAPRTARAVEAALADRRLKAARRVVARRACKGKRRVLYETRRMPLQLRKAAEGPIELGLPLVQPLLVERKLRARRQLAGAAAPSELTDTAGGLKVPSVLAPAAYVQLGAARLVSRIPERLHAAIEGRVLQELLDARDAR